MKNKFLIVYIFLLISMVNNLDGAWRKNTSMPLDYQDVFYLDVYFLPSNPQYGWICGYEGKTLRTTDGGKNWLGSRILASNGLTLNVQLESIHFVSELVGFTSGPNLANGRGVIYKTIDGGANWINITPSSVGDLWGNYFLNESVGVVIGEGCGNPQQFWRTSDGGANWSVTLYKHPDSKMADAIIYSENGIAYAIGSGVLWKSTNGGLSWLPFGNTGAVDWHEEIANIGTTFLIPYSEGCFGNTGSSYGGIRISNDEGKSWSQYSTGVPMFGTFLFDKLRGWAAGFDRTVIYTEDGGKTWTYDNCGIESGAGMDDIWFINDTTGWVVGDGVYEYFIPSVDAPQISPNGDIYLCKGDSLQVSASDGYDAYIWSNGVKGKTITVTNPGKYSVRGFIDSICYNGISEEVNVNYYEEILPEFVLSTNGDPCIGDTVTVSLKDRYLQYEWFDGTTEPEIKVSENSTVEVRLIDTNGCEVFGSYPVQFQANPIPIVKVNGRLNFCTGDSVLLSTTQLFNKYEWYNSETNELISENASILIKNSGKYYVRVINSSGCEGVSGLTEVNVRDESNLLRFSLSDIENFSLDSAYYSQLNCRLLKIENIGFKDYTFDDVYFFRNISFSAPQSQFPIVVPAQSETDIKICFSPSNLGLNRDSILIGDVCSDHLIGLLGFGISEIFEDETKCDVPIEFILTGFDNHNFSFGMADPTPNPANDKTTIKYSFLTNDYKISDFKVRIYDVYGQEINLDIMTNIKSSTENIINGEMFFDTHELIPGLYVIAFDFYGKMITGKFMVSR